MVIILIIRTKVYFINSLVEHSLEIIRNHPHLIDAIEQLYDMAIEGNEDEYLESWK